MRLTKRKEIVLPNSAFALFDSNFSRSGSRASYASAGRAAASGFWSGGDKARQDRRCFVPVAWPRQTHARELHGEQGSPRALCKNVAPRNRLSR